MTTGEARLGRAAWVSLQLLLVAAALAVVGFVLVNLRLVVLPVLAALFVATILGPPTDWLRRRGWPRGLAAVTSMLVGIGVVATLVTLLAPRVIDEFGDLGESLREGLGQIGAFVANLGISEAQVDQAIDAGLGTFQDVSSFIGQGVVTGALLLLEAVAAGLITLVVLFFFLKDGDRIWSWFVRLLPAPRRADARELGDRSWTTLGDYVRGVAFVALIDATLIGIALAILGVPLVLPLAVLVFFASFFPLVGAITAGFVAALVALVLNGPITALIVVAVIIGIQQLEGNLIYPVVMGRQVELHPVAILLSVTAGGVVAGVVGALFAVPVAAVAWTAISYFRGDLEPEPEADRGALESKPAGDSEEPPGDAAASREPVGPTG